MYKFLTEDLIKVIRLSFCFAVILMFLWVFKVLFLKLINFL